jgi:branched-chain amino acid transport system ATP-binding protein
MTVRENVEVGARFGRNWPSNDRVEADCAQALTLAGLVDVADELAGALTLGEKKRLELARCLASRPELLLLDEVMGGLSAGEIRELVQALKRVHASGVTVVMIEHVLHALFQLVGRVLVLDFGRKIGDGEPSAIMSQPEVIGSYLGRPLHQNESVHLARPHSPSSE